MAMHVCICACEHVAHLSADIGILMKDVYKPHVGEFAEVFRAKFWVVAAEVRSCVCECVHVWK